MSAGHAEPATRFVDAEPHLALDEDTGRPWPTPDLPEPDHDTLAWWLFDGVAEATDGCEIEPDGVCEHGHPSWLRRLGLI